MAKTGFIQEELKANTPILASLQQLDVYTVPSGYFEHLVFEIQARINEDKLFVTSSSNVFQIPDGYFETLSDAVISRIETKKNEVFAELENIAPSLNSISKKNVYCIPSNYFENFTVTKDQKTVTKVVSFSNPRKWISYAAAAIIGGLLFTGGFLYDQHRNTLDVTNELNKVSDTELNAYVENGGMESSEDNNLLEFEKNDIKQNLKIISEDDLQQYLKDAE